MLDQKITQLADKMIRIQFEEREEQLRRDIDLAQSKMAIKGLGHGSAVVRAVYDLCAHDVEIRALIVWQNLVRVLSNAGVLPSEGLAEDLKEAVLKYVPSIYSYPHECLEKVVRLIGIGSANPLTVPRDRAVMKVNAEIELFVLSLHRRTEAKEKQGESPQPVFNFYSPVGAIQTGPGATATVVQMLGPQDREALRNALDRLKQDLTEVEKLPGYEKDEVLDFIEEGRAEVEKARPNSMRLTSVFSAIATAIQTAGSLQPAYQVLKAALLPLGIALP